VIVERAAPEGLAGGVLVIEQRATTAVESPDRGDPRRRRGDLLAKVLKHRGRDDLNGIERAAGHLQEAELQRESHTVHRRAAP